MIKAVKKVGIIEDVLADQDQEIVEIPDLDLVLRRSEMMGHHSMSATLAIKLEGEISRASLKSSARSLKPPSLRNLSQSNTSIKK